MPLSSSGARVGKNLKQFSFLPYPSHPYPSKVKEKGGHKDLLLFKVPGQGFEPQFPGSEPGVLPLDDPGLLVSQLGVLFVLKLSLFGNIFYPPTI